MTPEELDARRAELREAGVKLRRRPAGETLAALARALDAWSDSRSPWRRALADELPAATGFSPACVREGLRRGLDHWDGGALGALVAREIGPLERLDGAAGTRVSGFDTTAVLLAGSIPMPSLLSLLSPLALRSPVLAKAASRDPVTPRLVARSLAETDSDLGRCLATVEFPGSDEACVEALLRADCVVATGSDASVAAVAARVRPPRRLIASGHRISLAALGAGATRGATLDRAARGLALDVALWDQLGCLSPVAVYVADPEGAAADRVAERLADALGRAETRWPRGRVGAAAAALIARERSDAQLRAAAGRRVALHAPANAAWTVVREDAPAPRPDPLHRFVRVVPVSDVAGLLDALRRAAPPLAGVAIEGFGADTSGVARALADLGASRICRPGALQSPPLAWRREGRGVLGPLARFADLEVGGDSESDAS